MTQFCTIARSKRNAVFILFYRPIIGKNKKGKYKYRSGAVQDLCILIKVVSNMIYMYVTGRKKAPVVPLLFFTPLTIAEGQNKCASELKCCFSL